MIPIGMEKLAAPPAMETALRKEQYPRFSQSSLPIDRIVENIKKNITDEQKRKANEIVDRLRREVEKLKAQAKEAKKMLEAANKIMTIAMKLIVPTLIGTGLGAVLGAGLAVWAKAAFVPIVPAFAIGLGVVGLGLGLRWVLENGGPIYGPSHSQGGVWAELEGGENVWSRRDVAAMGGQRAVEALKPSRRSVFAEVSQQERRARRAEYMGWTRRDA